MQAGVADASEWIRSKLGGAAECFLGAYGRVQQKLRRTELAASKTLEMPRLLPGFDSVNRVQEFHQPRQHDLRSPCATQRCRTAAVPRLSRFSAVLKISANRAACPPPQR